MAETSGRISVPAPQIFNSDPVEQIFSKGVLDRDMSGLSYMMLNAARGQREQDQQAYMQGIKEAQRLTGALHQQDMMQKMLTEALKQGPEYAKAGLPVANVPLFKQVFGDVNDPQTAEASALVNLLKKAQIAKDMASAAASGQEKEETQVAYGPTGPQAVVQKFKGPGSQQRAETAAQRTAPQFKQGGTYALNGNSPGGPTPMSPIMQQMLFGR